MALTNLTVAEIYRAAAARIRRGWCQGMLSDGVGGVCAQGALMDVVFGKPDHMTFFTHHLSEFADDLAFMKSIAASLHQAIGRPNGIADWNNARGQTAENVAAAMELAAILWEQEQPEAEVLSPVLAHPAVREGR